MAFLSKIKLDDASQRAYTAFFWYATVQLVQVLYAIEEDQSSQDLIPRATVTSISLFSLSLILTIGVPAIAYFFGRTIFPYDYAYISVGTLVSAGYVIWSVFEAYSNCLNAAAFNANLILLAALVATAIQIVVYFYPAYIKKFPSFILEQPTFVPPDFSGEIIHVDTVQDAVDFAKKYFSEGITKLDDTQIAEFFQKISHPTDPSKLKGEPQLGEDDKKQLQRLF